MVEATLNDTQTALSDDDKRAVQGLVRQMNDFMAEHGSGSPYTPLDPDNFTNDAYQSNFALFMNAVKIRFNALNDAPDQDESTPSPFRTSWNAAAHDSLGMDLDHAGQDMVEAPTSILDANGCLDFDTVRAFNVFLAMRAPQSQDDGITHYFNSTNSQDAPQAKQLYDTITALKDVYSTAFAEQDIPAPDGYVYDDKLDRTLDDAMRPRIIHLQTALGITPNGHMDDSTQRAVYTLLQNNMVTVDGELNALSNEHIIDELDSTLNRLVDKHREDARDAVRTRQTNLLGSNGFSDDESDAILQVIDQSADIQSARSTLNTQLSAETAKRSEEFLEQIWMMEFERRAALKGDIIAQLSNDDRALFAANDIMSHIFKGGVHNSLLAKAGAPEKEDSAYTEDWFFEKEAYDALLYGNSVDGISIPGNDTAAGIMFTPEEVSNIAYNLLQQRLSEAGIAPKDLTQALVTGEFTLSYQDLKLIQQSYPRPTLNEVLNNPEYRDDLFSAMNSGLIHVEGLPYPDIKSADTKAFLERALANPTGDEMLAIHNAYNAMPDFVMSNTIDDYRNQAFNQEFGSLADVTHAKTLENQRNDDGSYSAQEIERSGAQLAVELISKYRTPENFELIYGVNKEEALAAIGTDGHIDKTIINPALQQQIAYTTSHFTVVDFFGQGSGDGSGTHPSTLHANFQALRARNITEKIDDQLLDRDNDHTGYANVQTQAPSERLVI